MVRRGTGAHGLDVYMLPHENCYVLSVVGVAGTATHERWLDPAVPSQFSANPNRTARITVLEIDDARHLALTGKDYQPSDIWAKFSAIPFDENGIVVGLLGERVLSAAPRRQGMTSPRSLRMDNQHRIPISDTRRQEGGHRGLWLAGSSQHGSVFKVLQTSTPSMAMC